MKDSADFFIFGASFIIKEPTRLIEISFPEGFEISYNLLKAKNRIVTEHCLITWDFPRNPGNQLRLYIQLDKLGPQGWV